MSEVAEYVEVHRHPEPKSFIWKYIFSLDHKVIGIQYILLAIVAVCIGMGLSLLMTLWSRLKMYFQIKLFGLSRTRSESTKSSARSCAALATTRCAAIWR